MKNRVKAGLGLVGLGAISVGGVAAADPSLLGIGGKNSIPPWLALSKDHDFVKDEKKENIDEPNVVPQNVSDTYKSKFGETYKNYLVGVVGSTKSGNNVNKDFWEWSFERLKKETTVSNNFKYSEKENDAKVFRAVSSDANGKGLNQVCKKAYEAQKENVTSNVGSDDNKYKEEDVWKFCSPVGQKPTTVQQYDKNYYGARTVGNEYKSQLISVRDPNNRWFWEIRDWEIMGNNRITRVGVNWIENNYFYIQIRNKHIKDLCASAYSSPKDGNSDSRLTNNEVEKYCVLSVS